MIGQERLINQINKYSAENFPQTLMIVGDKGSGRHTLIKEHIYPLLNKPVVDMSSGVSFDDIVDITLDINPSIYLIDVDNLSERHQNTILKFIEEPINSVNLLLITTSLEKVLSTVRSRCLTWYMDDYSNAELLNFTKDASILEFIRTPGELLRVSPESIVALKDLCEKILLLNKKASTSNLITVSEKIDWGEKDTSLYSVELFYEVMMKVCLNLFVGQKLTWFKYKLTNECINLMRSNIQFDRKRIFEKYLIELKYGEG